MAVPRPELPVRTISTIALRIPRADWAHVRLGVKTELRMAGRGTPLFQHRKLPTPVVGYSFKAHRDTCEQQLLVLEAIRQEPLGAITQESIAAEGFGSYSEFRSYWKTRFPRTGWRPLGQVVVFTIRPFREDDVEPHAHMLLDLLYGPWLGSYR